MTRLTPEEIAKIRARADRVQASGYVLHGDMDRQLFIGHIDALSQANAEQAGEIAAQASEIAALRKALEPFAGVGQWLFARPLPDDTPVVELPGLNGYQIILTRGHFKEAHRARMAGETKPLP